QTVMGERIDYDMIFRADEAANNAVAGRPTGGIEQRMFELQEVGNGALQLQRKSRIAEEGSGAGAVYAIFIDRGFGRLLDGRMRGEAEIILGGEIHSLERHYGVD